MNLIAYQMQWDYLISVNFVLGGLCVMLFTNAVRVFKKTDWKLFIGISIFSNIFTFIVELVMLKFDVWGFSGENVRLLGITLFGAPIEEYIFWMYCPWLVGLSYITCARTEILPSINISKLTAITSKFSKLENSTKSKINSDIEYIDNSNGGQYSRGRRLPIYITIQLVLFAMILYLKGKYKGNWRAMILTTLFFILTMAPYEQYAISQGFWTYNANTMIGLFILNVPFEGWLMYVLPPIAGSMITDVFNNKFFNNHI